jgi:hypothetical protein
MFVIFPHKNIYARYPINAGGEWYSDFESGARSLGGGGRRYYKNPIVMVRIINS